MLYGHFRKTKPTSNQNIGSFMTDIEKWNKIIEKKNGSHIE